MTIKKGTHSPLRLPCVTTDPEVRYHVTFMPSCRYDIGAEQGDINKLFGIGYLPHHHDNSVRIGWRYEKESDMIELLAYWYDNGVRHWESIGFVAIGQKIACGVSKVEDIHEVEANFRKARVPVRPRPVAYLLRPYFGGNMTAPHDIQIEMKRI